MKYNYVLVIPVLFVLSLMMFSSSDAYAIANSEKYDKGFAEYIQQKIDNTPQGEEMPKIPVLIHFTVDYQGILKYYLNYYGAENIYISSTLTYASADVPADNIADLLPGINIIKIGLEQQLTLPELNISDQRVSELTMEQAKEIVGGQDISTYDSDLGEGQIIVLIDNAVDFTHIDLVNNKFQKTECLNVDCFTVSAKKNNHATGIASIIVGNSDSDDRDGIASEAKMLNFVVGDNYKISYVLDKIISLKKNVALTSHGTPGECNEYNVMSMLLDKLVGSGVIFSVPVGNSQDTINTFACGYNTISVGSVGSDGVYSETSSQGPTSADSTTSTIDRIKPEITAIGENIQTAKIYPTIDNPYRPNSGTSYANAFVAGSNLLIKDIRSDFNSMQIKSALLIGADWKATVPSTANDYENKVNGVYDTMNKYGFGVLDIDSSLKYAKNSNQPNVIYVEEGLDNNDSELNYGITAKEGEEVKVILSWFLYPTKTTYDVAIFPEEEGYLTLYEQYSNYDLKITHPDGTEMTSSSLVQNNEFVVFNAPETGTYKVTVYASDVNQYKLTSFSLASTHAIGKPPHLIPITFENVNEPLCDIVTPRTDMDFGDIKTGTVSSLTPSITISVNEGHDEVKKYVIHASNWSFMDDGVKQKFLDSQHLQVYNDGTWYSLDKEVLIDRHTLPGSDSTFDFRVNLLGQGNDVFGTLEPVVATGEFNIFPLCIE